MALYGIAWHCMALYGFKMFPQFFPNHWFPRSKRENLGEIRTRVPQPPVAPARELEVGGHISFHDIDPVAALQLADFKVQRKL